VLGAGFAHKNLNYAFELVKSVRNTLPEIKLVFVGPKPTFGSDEDFYKNSEVKQNEWVNIYSWLSDKDLLEQIRKSSVVLYPSLSEGFGFIPFEAAKLGKASLFSKTTSIAEFFPNSPVTLTFSLEADRTTLIALLTDAGLYEKQVRYVNSVGEEYSWKRVTEKLDNVFRGLILKERYFQSGSAGNSISIVSLLDFIRYLGTRKVALVLFPPFSKRRNFGIQILRKIFL
jgi:glycosyltransferase involved in cell wall biosynthesis